MVSPVVKMTGTLALPRDWISNDQDESGVAGSSAELPADVEVIPEPPFRPRGQRVEARSAINHVVEPSE